MIKARFPARAALVLLCTLALAACGGGSSSASAPVALAPASSISGVFDGQTTDGQPLTALLQADGSYYFVYSDAAAPHAARGALVGTAVLANGSLSSSNGFDLDFAGGAAAALTLSASYTAQSLSGSFSHSAGGAPNGFSASYSNLYATLPALAALAGDYTGTIATRELSENKLILTISADGKLSGKMSCNCLISATLAPRSDGKAYVANLAMAEGSHVLSNKTFAGTAYFDTTQNRLYIIGNIVGSGELALFVGQRP